MKENTQTLNGMPLSTEVYDAGAIDNLLSAKQDNLLSASMAHKNFWVGDLSAYEELESKDISTLYFIYES